MIQRFLFYWVHAKTAGSTIAEHANAIILATTNETKPTLTLSQLTEPGTQVALQATIVKSMPVLGINRVMLLRHSDFHQMLWPSCMMTSYLG
jgi:hypothetical protein